MQENIQNKKIPAKTEAMAARRNDMTTEGPADSLATCPAKT